MSSGDSTTQQKIDAYIERLGREDAVRDYLDLPAVFALIHTHHPTHHTVAIHLLNHSERSLDKATILQVLDLLRDRIIAVRMFQRPSTIPSFLPEGINDCARADDAVVVAPRKIQLEQHCGIGFDSKILRFWLGVPGAGYCGVYMYLHLPSGWNMWMHHRGFSPETGEPAAQHFEHPKNIKGNMYLQGKSAQFITHWETTGEFINDYKGATA